MTRTLRLGTRRSSLAKTQSESVARSLEALHPGLTVDLVPIVTKGDRLPGDLAAVGGKGLFTEELEARLVEGTLDLAVHSLKDLPVALPDGLDVAAYPPRADPRDVLVSEAAPTLEELPAGAVLLTGSLRRRAQILDLRSDLEVEPIRGNVETRLRKWRQTGSAGVILAAAGLERLGIADVPAHPIDPRVMIPAPGQGTLAVQVKRGSEAEKLCRALDDPAARIAATAERLVVRAFGGDCTLPLAAFARSVGDGTEEIELDTLLATPDGDRVARARATGPTPETVAESCVAALREAGADDILAAVEAT